MALDEQDQKPDGNLLIYRADEAAAPIRVLLEGETVWLTQRLMAALYGTSVPNISQHISAIYEEEELRPEATVKKYLIVQTEGIRQVRRLVDHYNLAMIIAVGYRVRSARGTQFRQWATARLGEYLVKGFTLDDERLKGTASPVLAVLAPTLQRGSTGGRSSVRYGLALSPAPTTRGAGAPAIHSHAGAWERVKELVA